MTDTDITLRINGVKFTEWESVNVSKSLDNIASTFKFDSTNKLPGDYPVRAGDSVQILVSDKPIMTGFVDEITISGDSGKSSVSVSGRSKAADIVDSSVPDAAKDISGFKSISALCRAMISALGADIKVINNAGSFDSVKGESKNQSGSNSGANCASVLTSFARRSQVYITSAGDGSIVIFRPSCSYKSNEGVYNQKNGRNNNVKSWSLKQAHQDRFHTYKITSQGNFSAGYDDYSKGTDFKGTLIDNDIRKSRYLELQAEESSDDGECSGRANEQANMRRSKSIEYTVTLATYNLSNGGAWDVGQIIPVRDDFAGINGYMFVKSISISQSNSSGTSVELVLACPDAFQVTGVPTILALRSASIGKSFVK